MLRSDQAAAADGRPKQDREGHLAAEHVVDLGGLIDDLVHRDKAERHLAPVRDRTEAAAGCADRHAGKGCFGNRCRLDPLRAELVE